MKNMRPAKIHKLLILCILPVLLFSGCQSPTMKGTPFYTGEYEGPEEGYTDRVNLWPALYYRNPALSIFWPFFELTDDHTALRPVYSVYNKKSDKPIYNVCWPIARFDTGEQSNRIFPFYWGKNGFLGDEYFVGAPLYWHLDDPFDGAGVNALFPLWIWNAKKDSRRLDLLWPIYANKKSDTENLWRVWPLYGVHSWDSGKSVDRFWAWPFGGSTNSEQMKEHYLLPLYYAGNTDLHNDFWTLLGGRSRGPDSTRWAVFPALSWGEKTSSSTQNTYLLGLAGNKKTADEKSSYILPLYAKRDSKDSSYLFSLPYSTATAADGSEWEASLPFFHSQTDATGASRLITPLYSRKNDPAGNNLWRCYFPLLYLDESYDNHFMTLLGGRWRTGDNSGWLATPILSGGTKTPDCEKTIWVGGLAGKKSTAKKTAHYAVPFYYSCPQEKRFLSLPYLRWVNSDQTCYRIIPPLLSGTATKGASKRTSVLADLAYLKKQDDKPVSSGVLPFYAWEKDKHFFTLLYGKTKTATYFATPLIGRYLDKKGGWVFPLWQHKATDQNTETDILLGLGSKYKTAISNGHYLFPLWQHEVTDQKTKTDILLGLGGKYKKETGHGHHLFPLYSKSQSQYDIYSKEKLTGHRKNFNALILLWNNQTRTIDAEGTTVGERSTSGLFPLWHKKMNRPRNGKQTMETASLLFRLYDFRRVTPKNNTDKPYTRHRVLWRLYHNETLGNDSSTDIFPAITIDKKEDGFRKVSFLWRLFRYEHNPAAGTKKLDLLFIPVQR